MFKGIEMGLVLILLTVFALTDTIKYNGHLVTMPIRLVVIGLCIATLIHAAQAFK